MRTIKGPGIFLAQFVSEEAPFNTLDNICKWAAQLGYKGVQIPSWEKSLIDLEKASESKSYCEQIKGTVEAYGMEISELSAHLQGQLIAVHPAYDILFDSFADPGFRNDNQLRSDWATDQIKKAIAASQNLGLKTMATFSGALAWPYIYPWPQRPEGLVEKAFEELASRWTPLLNYARDHGVDLCYELHPGEDLHDGISFEMFLDKVAHHPSACILYDPSHFLLQQMDYLQFIDIYHDRIKMFHVKDAEFNPSGRQGVYGGFQPWKNRAGRFRSPGDGEIDFGAIFSKLTQYGFEGWAVLEWECCIKSAQQGAEEGAAYISDHIIKVGDKSFDDFAGTEIDDAQIKKILGI